MKKGIFVLYLCFIAAWTLVSCRTMDNERPEEDSWYEIAIPDSDSRQYNYI